MTAVQTLEDRRYTKDHEWAKKDDDEGQVTIGITAFAVEQLGDITLVGLDVGVGDEVRAGEAFGTIESVKTLSDLYAPLSGKVVSVNESLENEPELVNEDPWEMGWMIVIEPSNFGGEKSDLIDASAYQAHVESLDH
ncbi:MAG: glycine cleavage system protein GcvH [Polyangiaceae bacterium]|nr:glycine cleavage system protein GcvH [Polyangiaceae bacterium]